jgi:hypothetical protein
MPDPKPTAAALELLRYAEGLTLAIIAAVHLAHGATP